MGNKCTLSNAELIQRCQEWVSKLAASGGREWCLQVPANYDRDPDLMFNELGRRLQIFEDKAVKLSKVLKHISEQHKSDEMEVEGDFEEGYNAIVALARDAYYNYGYNASTTTLQGEEGGEG